MNETLRVSGTAEIVTDPDVLEPLSMKGRPPVSVLRVTVERAFLHCAKALIRARLWDPAAQVERASLPTYGQMLADQIRGADAGAIDAALDEAAREPALLSAALEAWSRQRSRIMSPTRIVRSTLDHALVEAVDSAARRLGTTRSAFTARRWPMLWSDCGSKRWRSATAAAMSAIRYGAMSSVTGNVEQAWPE